MQALHIPAYYDPDLAETQDSSAQTFPEKEDMPEVRDEQASIGETSLQPLVVELPKEEDPADEDAPADSLAPIQAEQSKRLGIHYFADQEHYSQADLDLWLPVLKELGVNWIVLQAPVDRAVPQEFVEGLAAAELQPILHLNAPLAGEQRMEDFAAMFRAYASWGGRHIILFDRPNLRAQWPGQAWTQRDLVDRFLAKYVPLAHAALEAGLTPVFPALEPGGDYWDTAFLRSALESLVAKGEGLLLESMALGAYAWTEDRPMTWGAGGPESWPATMPYFTPEGSQDQRGFRIFDWYNAIARTVLGNELPILILAAGVQRENTKQLDANVGTRAVKMAETLLRPAGADKNNTVPANVLACNFWLLSADPQSMLANTAWFALNGKATKVGREWQDWHQGAPKAKSVKPTGEVAAEAASPLDAPQALSHYLLLPNGVEYPVDAIRDFLQATNATVGTSTVEAARAARVTLAGGMEAFADDLIRKLIQAGCTLNFLALDAA